MMHMKTTQKITIAILALAILFSGCAQPGTEQNQQQGNIAQPSAPPVTTNIEFASHIDAGFPEQDVFVKEIATSSQVFRLEKSGTLQQGNLEKIVFATATETAHNPFKTGDNALGPFIAGQNLGFTLKQWLEATGKGTYSVAGSDAVLRLSFQKLVPNGVYTVLCSRITMPPNAKIVDAPCGKADGSDNAFLADKDGNGKIEIALSPLQQSTNDTKTAIAIAFHSDGKSYGASAGPYGQKTHVQLVYMMPTP
ncbi:MAG TPA: hypothetical protein VJH23_02785 [archaeon]|nr:hypothetical protein [archaeon]